MLLAGGVGSQESGDVTMVTMSESSITGSIALATGSTASGVSGEVSLARYNHSHCLFSSRTTYSVITSALLL